MSDSQMSDAKGSNSSGVPVWFWIVAGVALAWNLIGMMMFIGDSMITQEALASMVENNKMTQERMDLMLATPIWAKIAFGAATIGGLIGCLGLLMRQSWAQFMLVISLAGILAQQAYMYLISGLTPMLATDEIVVSTLVLVIAIALIPFSMMASKRGWLS